MPFTLTAQQEEAMRRIIEFIADNESQIFILKGYAGTGKTSLVASIVDYLGKQHIKVQIMAPTGRAAKVLSTKVPSALATTIHRGIYQLTESLESYDKSSTNNNSQPTDNEISKNKENGSNVELKYSFSIREKRTADIIIVDESSMIASCESRSDLFNFGTNILLNDLLSYAGLPVDAGANGNACSHGKVIFVGDPMQLPPVGEKDSAALSESFFLDHKLQVQSYTLTDIIRQKNTSCILANAMKIRNLLDNTERNCLTFERKECEVMNLDEQAVVEKYCENDRKTSSIICYTNQQASAYNHSVRKKIFPEQSEDVCAGDRLMIVSNNYYNDHELFNGDIINVVDVDTTNCMTITEKISDKQTGQSKDITLTFKSIHFQEDDGSVYKCMIFDSLLHNDSPSLSNDEMKALYINTVKRISKLLNINDKKSHEFRAALKSDPYYNALQVKYGYAFTCHKSQGGEWDTVYVDFTKRLGLDDDSLRWKYTAITRASNALWCVNFHDITPLSKIEISIIVKTNKIPSDAVSLYEVAVEETPYHQPTALPSLKKKYHSVLNNMVGTAYSIKSVDCKPWRDIYHICTPNGEARVDVVYNKSGTFTKYDARGGDSTLLAFFTNEDSPENSVQYKIDYHPDLESLKSLHNQMISLCDDFEITITNVVEKQYQVVYYMKATGNFASLAFNYNAKGSIHYALPSSTLGSEDTKLKQLIEKLQ